MDAKKDARRQRPHVKMWCSAHEKQAIEGSAQQLNLTTSSYLRLVGLGYKPRSMIDVDHAENLVRVNGDLGRLGGLLKLWLSDDAKLDAFGAAKMQRVIRGVLAKIEANQDELRRIVKSVLRTRQ